MKIKSFLIFFLIIIIFQNMKGENMFVSETKDKTFVKKESKFQKRYRELDKYYSTKKLGSFVENGKTYFRLFAPQAIKIVLCTFNQPEDTVGKEYEMLKDDDGVWEFSLDGELYGLFYGYRVYKYENLALDGHNVISVDPYAKAVATFNTYLSPRRAIVIKENDFNWEEDSWIKRDWRDLIIYEMHIRDITAHPSSGAKNPGSYTGLTEKNITGGIDYIKSLGINTVELLPSMEFANIELPYKKSFNGRYNDWNPYERNHWGYMTSSFFAPAAYYSENWKEFKWNVWQGKTAKQINDFKNIVKTFHKEGIAVMMDVVFNHLSEYELGNLKEIDKEYYFRLDQKGNFISQSGCGNDLKTERPMVRRMIIESILYWMTEYHIDGFRFDLGKLIDWETLEEIIYEARKINPSVIFVAEPWGGGYDPMGFSLRDWGSWNDQIRNGIKGENPFNGLGWIFGKWYGNNNINRIKSYVNGTLIRDQFGLFQKKEHSVNYLESHDGYTLGDFIRIALDSTKANTVIKDVDSFVKLSPIEMKLNKLAALFLLTSQGITMIHSGQEFARTKIIPYDIWESTPSGKVNDKNKGKIDHNSYEKDNETNYINYNHKNINIDLVNYYKGLIQLRKKFEAFRKANYEDIIFYDIQDNEFALQYLINYGNEQFLVLLNANQIKEQNFLLPDGNWEILVNPEIAQDTGISKINNSHTVEPVSGFILKKSK